MVLQTHVWRNEFCCLDYPYHKEESHGNLRVSTAFVGAHVVLSS